MKKTTMILIVLTAFNLAFGQTSNCENWIKTITDKVTGKTYMASRTNIIIAEKGAKNGFIISFLQDGETIITIEALGAGACIDKGDKINILFDDGSRMELKNQSSFNCKMESTIYLGGIWGQLDELSQLKTKKIATMRVWVMDSFVQKDFTEANKEYFFNAINCLTK